LEGGDFRMSSIDSRVVQMLFDNAAFEKGVATTMASLSRLNDSLKLSGGTSGLEAIDAEASKGLSIGNLANGLDSISSKFSALGVIGVTALANITNKVIDAGITIAKNFVIDPIKDGLEGYQQQIQATQTILANTASEGTNLTQVTGVLKDLQQYANLTVYSFSDMATSIGTFTAAGVDLNTSVSAIKGIANLAAFSGSTSQQASTAMYQLSQAIAAGKVQLQDWNSVVNAGLGGKTFQTALENTARVSGVAIDSIVKKAGGFRNSLQQGWLTSTILTKTLAQFTGDLSVAQIKAMGYTEAQAEAIYKQSQTAVDAATKVKTLNQLTQALKEEVATAYASIFKTIFGNIDQATTLFSSIHNAAENALTGPIYALGALLQGWSDLGGRAVLIQALTDVIHNLGAAVKVVESAFRSVFPATTSEQLVTLTKGFKDFVDRFKLTSNGADDLKRTLAGVFSIISLGIFVIKQIITTLGSMLTYMGAAPGNILAFTAKLGDLLVKFKDFVEQGQGVQKFFQFLGDILPITVTLLQNAATWVGNLFDKFQGKDPSGVVSKLNIQLGPMGGLLKGLNDLWAEFSKHLDGIEKVIEPIAAKFDSFFKNLASSIGNAVGSLNFQDVVNLINTGLFGALILLLKKFVASFGSKTGGLGEIVDTIKETFGTLNETFETMQKTLKAATLLAIAAAVALLTISVIALSKIDSQGLIRAGAAITVMFTELMGTLVIFEKFIEGEGWAKLPVMFGSLILLATAIDILVIAVKALAGLSWDGLAKGLTGLTVMLGELLIMLKLMGSPEGLIASGLGLTAFAKGVKVLSDAVVILSALSWSELTKGLVGVGVLLGSLGLFEKFAGTESTGILSGAGIILLATSIKILASSMGTFAALSWDQIAKGLVSIAGGLGLIGAALYLIPPSSVISAAGVLLVASSLGLIGDAIGKMGNMSWSTIGKGLTELAGALTLIAAALFVLPPSTLLSAAAIFVVATSLGLVADALVKMGGMSWDQIAKSLVELAGSLTIIAAAMIFMIEALPGAAALLVVTAALLLLLPVITTMGNMPWASLGEALAGLAGVFVILGAAGLLLTPLVPVLLALGAAIALMGVGVALAGAGVFLFATGLTALAAAGTVAAAALTGIVSALLGLLPQVGKEIGIAVIAFATTISTAGPAIVKAITTVLDALIEAITKESPKINLLLGNLLVMFLNDIVKYSPQINSTFMKLVDLLLSDLVSFVPKYTNAGINILIAVLNGIASRIGQVVTAGTNIVIAFINAIGSNAARLAQAGVQMIINFVNSLANEIRADVGQMRSAGLNLASALIDGMTGGLTGGIGDLLNKAKSMGGSVVSTFKSILGIHSPSTETFAIGAYTGQGLVNGIVSMGDAVTNAASNVGSSALLSMGKTIAGMSDLINANVNVNPTITPVLDLTSVKKSAGQINDILTPSSVSVGTSTTSAKIASAGQLDNSNAIVTVANSPTTPAPISYTQNNYSPKAISAADLYRQTKNQLSTVRGVLVYQDGGNEQPG
jgi:tape measure domain-containing protein